MARVSRAKHEELKAFWRFHHDAWAAGRLNQREYCELHGLPLKRFGNWRAEFKTEEKGRKSGLLYRRGGLKHMSEHMSDREIGELSVGYIPSSRPTPEARRNFSLADKKRILAEAGRPGASVSAVARRHGITARLLFGWKRELAPPAPPVFVPVTMDDGASLPGSSIPLPPPVPAPPIIVERARHEIEVELVGGRRVRFAQDTDPATVRAMIAVLEGDRS